MNSRLLSVCSVLLCVVVAFALLLAVPADIRAQRGQAPQRVQSGREAAITDLTGTWVAVVTEDWYLRMVTPKKGDYHGVPLNQAARKIADSWDPAKDEAAKEACKAYGAPGILRLPTRLKISWENDNTLRMDTDAGMQTRLFYFDKSQPKGQPSWQGYSVAEWNKTGGQFGYAPGGHLSVVTNNLRPGYLRKNGVPYSANAVVTDHFYRVNDPDGTSYLFAVTFVDDPQYLNRRLAMNQQFKKVPDGSGWNPTPCVAE
jgi:hypothetical protein